MSMFMYMNARCVHHGTCVEVKGPPFTLLKTGSLLLLTTVRALLAELQASEVLLPASYLAAGSLQ